MSGFHKAEPEPECSQFVAATKARFLAERDNSIRQRFAEAKTQEPIMQGHDLSGKECFHPETRHTITLEVVHVLSHETVDSDQHVFITGELIKKYAPAGNYSIFLCGPQALYPFADSEIEKLFVSKI